MLELQKCGSAIAFAQRWEHSGEALSLGCEGRGLRRLPREEEMPKLRLDE